MTNNQKKELVIGILGMPDNEKTIQLIQYLSNNDVSIDFVISISSIIS